MPCTAPYPPITGLAIITPSHALHLRPSLAPTPLLPALRPDRLHSAAACTLLHPALLPAPALLCTSSCALHQIACTLLALLRPTAGNDAPTRPSHHQHSTPLPPCTPSLHSPLCAPDPAITPLLLARQPLLLHSACTPARYKKIRLKGRSGLILGGWMVG
ncbi:hypothetical protein SLEP1_g13203 [Rubroshorea leprosula]|uniref:Uncharacterized protein n=1 Tax=Rubroshorea leprosula TaxID=152421 RepID=A0AAV5IN34_9ROSI|nr:hypothetical protein SLEP1_g13203 [Rubroshorea leprosula]